MKDNVQAAGERFLSEYAKADSPGRSILRQKGQKLARQLHSAAIDLSHSKVTEFSPDIPALFLLAAKVAYLTYGAGAPELEPFERDVYYYANFTPPDPIVAAYETFKKSTI